MSDITLVPGDIMVYRYRGEDEYAIWNGDGTRTLIGGSDDMMNTEVAYKRSKVKAVKSKRIVRCVWKGGKWQPRKVES